MAASHTLHPEHVVAIKFRAQELDRSAFGSTQGLHHNCRDAVMRLDVLHCHNLLERSVVYLVTASSSPDVHDWWWAVGPLLLAVDGIHLDLNFNQEA